MHDIRIGTFIGYGSLPKLPQLLELGFECFMASFWQTTGDVDLKEYAKRLHDALDPAGVPITNQSIFGNPLTGHGKNADTRTRRTVEGKRRARRLP